MHTNDTEVICPGCAHQFRAVPVSVQRTMSEITEALINLLAYETRDNSERYSGHEVEEILSAARAALSKATGGKS